jgi:hypothetical protein
MRRGLGGAGVEVLRRLRQAGRRLAVAELAGGCDEHCNRAASPAAYRALLRAVHMLARRGLVVSGRRRLGRDDDVSRRRRLRRRGMAALLAAAYNSTDPFEPIVRLSAAQPWRMSASNFASVIRGLSMAEAPMKRSRRLTLEALEDRAVPALYGIPWSDPQHLTLSFAPDGTAIAGHTSDLFGALNAEMPTATWEREILEAVQAWVGNANISVGVVADGGEPFGTSGLTQGDPRFGDIRIGAQPMDPSVLSVSVPHDPYVSGTWSGDVLLNSNADFTAPTSNLYNVMLHEVGHVLGLADNDDPTSVMYRDTSSLPAALSPADVAAIQALYGQGPNDHNETASGNDTFQTATPIQYASGVPPVARADRVRHVRQRHLPDRGSNQSTPLVAYGALTAAGDADVFSLAAPRSEGPLTFLLQTAGISLLEPSLTVYDASGNVLGQAESTNVLGDTVTVTLSRVLPNSTYYVRVGGATQDEFGVGRFGLAVTFGEMEVSSAQIAAVLRGPYETLSAAQIAQVFHNPEGHLRTGYSAHNLISSALVLTTTPGYAARQHYEVIDHLGEGQPAFYQIQTPQSPSGAPVLLTASVNAFSPSGTAARVQVLDRLGNPVAADVLVNGNGTYTIQAANLLPGQRYYLELNYPGEYEAEGNGNCSLVINLGQPRALSRTFVGGTLTPAAPQQAYTLYVARTQLFQFDLSVDPTGGRRSASVELTITDQSGNVVFDLVAPAGQTASGVGVLLPPGAYTARFTAQTLRGPALPLAYNLHGNSLTDPIGPALNDATLAPLYSQPNSSSVPPSNPDPNATYYYYPNGAVITDPFVWVALVL